MSNQPDLHIVSESDPDRIANRTPQSHPTNERTNGRDGSDQHGWQSGLGSRRTGACSEIDGTVSMGSVIAAGELWRTNQRHERTRIGERDPIPSYVRAAIWYRDGGKCVDCHPEHPSGDLLHLDHIKPWSAGGSDTSDNLRLLCERHNVTRSNYIDFARPKRPVTWWCSNCYVLDEHVWDHCGYPDITCPFHDWRGPDPLDSNCRVKRAYVRAWRAGEERPTWHEIPPLTAFDKVAYCAHCNAPGMTEVVL